MDTLNIALLQIAPGPTLEENLEKGLAACKKAKDLGADIALFPEMWSNGYRIGNGCTVVGQYAFNPFYLAVFSGNHIRPAKLTAHIKELQIREIALHFFNDFQRFM